MSAGALGLALAIGALALFGTRAALSVAAGATIAVANLVTMSAIIRALLRAPEEDASAGASANASVETEGTDHVREGRRGGAAWGAFAVVKIVVLFGGVWILLTKGIVAPMALVVGYGVLPLGIAASSLSTSLAPRSRRSGHRSRTK